MRLIKLVYYFCFANCAVKGKKESDQDTHLSNISRKHNVSQIVNVSRTPPRANEDYNQQAFSYSGPVTKDIRLLNGNFKECLMQPSVISILFNNDKVLCDGFRKLTKRAQLDLVDQSKNYILKLFNLPSKNEILTMIKLPDDQFSSTLLLKLEQAGVDSRKASKQGKRFVQDRLVNTGTGILESILHYYWSSTPFRNEFLDRVFKTLASTLTTQEYFELESLLDWIHSEYYVMDKADYNKVKLIIKRHYTVPWNSSQYLRAWYSMRPLEGDSKPVPEPTYHVSY